MKKTMILTLLGIMLGSPLVSMAQQRDTSRFCVNLDRIENRLLEQLSNRVDLARDNHNNQIDKYKTLKQERLTNLDQRREGVQEKWEDRIEALKAGATAEQIKAIEVFSNAVEVLSNNRTSIVDEAVALFEAEVDELRDERVDAFNDMLERYKNAIADAFDVAEASCDAGDNQEDIKAQLRSDITALRNAFKEDRLSYGFRAKYKNLTEERRSIIQEAKTTFQTGFQLEKDILKKSFSL